MAHYVKKTTGLVGLKVEPNARPILLKLYKNILTALKPVPATSFYRRNLEIFVNERMKIVEENQDVRDIERLMGGIIVEESIQTAKKQLDYLPRFVERKSWDVKPVPIIVFPPGCHSKETLEELMKHEQQKKADK